MLPAKSLVSSLDLRVLLGLWPRPGILAFAGLAPSKLDMSVYTNTYILLFVVLIITLNILVQIKQY